MLKIHQFGYFLFAILSLNACSPKFNWREIKKEEPHLLILFPAKPSFYSRELLLSNNKITMNMLAADIDEVNFSLAYAKINKDNMNDNQQIELQRKLIFLMQEGMIKNINGIKIESKIKNSMLVVGKLPNGQKVKMYGKFDIHSDWIFQTIIVGKEQNISEEVADMFLSSLKIN